MGTVLGNFKLTKDIRWREHTNNNPENGHGGVSY